MNRIDTAFGALMAREEYCEEHGVEFDVWIAAERVAREYGVSEPELMAVYDDHCEAWRV